MARTRKQSTGGQRAPRQRSRLQDVAERAGVSTASASLVLRDLPGPAVATREAVLRAAAQLGYRPDRAASLLARRRARLLGITAVVSNPFHAELLEEIQSVAYGRGYDLLVSPMTRVTGQRRAIETLLDSRCEAILLAGPVLPAAELARLSADRVVVAIGVVQTVAGMEVVRAADDRGVQAGVEHLAGLGHRDIAFVEGPRGGIATLRRRGFRNGVRRHVGTRHVRLVPGGDREGDGGRAAQRLLHGDPPTAVMAYNDRCALGVVEELRRQGLSVPGDVSVVGFDDNPVARLGTVDLTTISQVPEQMAALAVQLAVERIETDRPASREHVLEPRLVVRHTTGPVRPGSDCC